MDLQEIQNEVMRKIGRNVLLYQQVEYVLKYLVSHGRISGDENTLTSRHEKRMKSVSRRTMGTVAGDFFNEIFGDDESHDSQSEDPTKIHISIAFRIETEEKHFELRRDKIAELVADRNELIHHLVPKLNTDSIDTWTETDRLLDLQREKILPELEYLQSVAKQFSDLKKGLGEILSSPEGRKHLFGIPGDTE